MDERKKYYHRNLPHYIPNDAPYFITFRLADTLPQSVREDRSRRGQDGITFRELDAHLDRGHGPTWLRETAIAEIVKEALHYRDGVEYELLTYTIMPNHVHLVIVLDRELQLYKVLQSLKRHTARQCNKLLGRTGDFWQHESYDHVVRDGELGRIIFYVLRNPVKAGLAATARLWPHSYVSPKLDGFDETEYRQSEV